MSSKITTVIKNLKKKIYAHKFRHLRMRGVVYIDGVWYVNQKECKIRFFNLFERMIDVDLMPNMDNSFQKVNVDVYVNGEKQTTWHFEKGVNVEKELPYWVFDNEQILLDRTLPLRRFSWNKIVFKIEKNCPLPKPPKGLFFRGLYTIPHCRTKFKLDYFNYISSKKKKSHVHRLFITTGNFSLINALCYIEETKNNAIQYEDNLLIFGAMTQQFSENNLQIASTHHFNKIMIVPIVDLEQELIKNEIDKIDEVISVWQGYTFSTIAKLYPQSKLTIILESVPLFRVRNMLPQKIEALYLHNYLGLLDYVDQKTEFPIWYLNKDFYCKILKNIREKYQLYIDVPQKDKYILFCAPCDLVRTKLPENNMINLILKLQEKGYKVLLKKHPRDPKDYTNSKIELLNTSFPVEFYDLSNILCVVGYQSNMLVTLAEDIPTFSYIPSEIQCGINPTQDRATYLTKKYVMPVDMLLNTNANDGDFKTLLARFKVMQKEFLKNVGKISEDTEFQKKFTN